MLGKVKSIVIVKLFQFLNKFQKKEEEIYVPKNILIINPQGVGDMVIFTPVVEAIGKKYPTAKITVLTSVYGAEVLNNNPFIAEVIITETIKKVSLRTYFSLLHKLRKKSYDCVIDTSFTCLSLKQMLLPLAIGAKIRIGYSRGGFSHLFPTYEIPWRKEHMIVMYSHIAELLGASVQLKPKLYLAPEDKKWAIDFLKQVKKPVIVVHPTCQGEEKKWPLENFAELILWLTKKYKGTILITGITKEKKEIEILEEKIKSQKRKIPVQTLLDLPLLRIAALLGHTNLLISIDTGIVHIATATKTPTLCLYGPTGQIFWKPYNENQIVLQKYPCTEIGNNPNPSLVIEYMQKCPVHGNACIKAISVDEVKQVIEEKFLN